MSWSRASQIKVGKVPWPIADEIEKDAENSECAIVVVIYIRIDNGQSPDEIKILGLRSHVFQREMTLITEIEPNESGNNRRNSFHILSSFPGYSLWPRRKV
jgi:hypothetical protein